MSEGEKEGGMWTMKKVSCPECGGELFLRRVEDLNVAEYRGHCAGCLWARILRLLRCGGCHGYHLFEWISESWRCIDCGHVRRDPSPPRGLEAGRPGGRPGGRSDDGR